jgi:hypothetical protein
VFLPPTNNFVAFCGFAISVDIYNKLQEEIDIEA